MQHQESGQNYLPVYANQEEYDNHVIPGNGMQMPHYEPEQAPEVSQFQELINLLYAGKWLILGAFAVLLLATAVYTYTRIPVYMAHSLVVLDNRLAPDLKDALDAAPNSTGSASRSVETEVYVLQRSLGVSRRVSARLQEIGQDPETGKALSLLAYGLDTDQLATVVQEHISVNRELVKDVLRISATSVEPGEARMLADLYAEEFVGHALGRSRSRLAATRFFLENEAGTRHREPQRLEEEKRQFLDRNRGLTLNNGTATLVARVAELEGKRDEAQLEIRMKEVLRKDMIKEIQTMEPQLVQQVAANVPAKIERVQADIAEIENKLDQIYRINPGLRGSVEAQGNATIVEFNNEISRLNAELAGLTAQYIQQAVVFGESSLQSSASGIQEFGRLRRQLAEEDLMIGRLRAQTDVVNTYLETFQSQLEDLPARTITLTQLERSINTTERAYTLLNEKLEDVRISEESEQGYAEIIRKAEMPFRPEFPNKPQNLILGGLMGLLIGLGLAVMRQQIYKNTVVSPEDIQKLGYPLLGVVPSMRAFIKHEYRGVKYVEHNGYLNDSCLISLQPPSSFVVDAYRRLRFNIHGVHGEGAMRTVLVTSPNPGEGKSITALNLAIASAQAGQRTVIIDTDLRRPSIHTKLGIESEPGFTEMVQRRKLKFRKALSHVDNLYVLTAGMPTEKSSEILSSREMPQFIHELKRLFDVVILDSPPFLLVSDPLILSALCDGTVIVAAAGKTKAEELHQGMHELQKIGGHVLGVMLNEFDPEGLFSTRTKYKYYSYTNHYSYQKQTETLLQS